MKAGNGVLSSDFNIMFTDTGKLDVKSVISIGTMAIDSTYDFCKAADSLSLLENCQLYVNNNETADYKKYGFTVEDWKSTGNDKWKNHLLEIGKEVLGK